MIAVISCGNEKAAETALACGSGRASIIGTTNRTIPKYRTKNLQTAETSKARIFIGAAGRILASLL